MENMIYIVATNVSLYNKSVVEEHNSYSPNDQCFWSPTQDVFSGRKIKKQ